jgi:hypothetical protein
MFLASLVQSNDNLYVSLGSHYSSYRLYRDTYNALEKWSPGGELGISFIPNIEFRLGGSRLTYEMDDTTFEYAPLTFCTSFNLLPFFTLPWFRLSGETGIGLYLWRGLSNGNVIVLSNGDTIDEKDIGFLAGLTFQLKPVKYIALEASTRYHYIASIDMKKYGYSDKDEKLWENGIGVRVIIPLCD